MFYFSVFFTRLTFFFKKLLLFDFRGWTGQLSSKDCEKSEKESHAKREFEHVSQNYSKWTITSRFWCNECCHNLDGKEEKTWIRSKKLLNFFEWIRVFVNIQWLQEIKVQVISTFQQKNIECDFYLISFDLEYSLQPHMVQISF